MTDDLFHRLAASVGYDVPHGANILDFGCGDGDLVERYVAAGYDAWGCDILIVEDRGRLKAILEPYALPFEDDSFDFIVSDQVFEHVQNPEAACAEIARVLRPGGLSIHVFPSKWRLIEPHVYVPLASSFRPRWWLAVWAKLGVRNEFQKDLSAAEVCEKNVAFLRDKTNYLSRSAIHAAFQTSFAETRFIEAGLMRSSRRIPSLAKPWIASPLGLIYSETYQRIVMAR